jgi:polyphosphate kinase 2 (PPK2 family)
MDEQERKFETRIDNPVRQWRLRLMDIEAYRRWYAYSRTCELLVRKTAAKYDRWI